MFNYKLFLKLMNESLICSIERIIICSIILKILAKIYNLKLKLNELIFNHVDNIS